MERVRDFAVVDLVFHDLPNDAKTCLMSEAEIPIAGDHPSSPTSSSLNYNHQQNLDRLNNNQIHRHIKIEPYY